MIDRTYQQALEATEPPHRVILGPLACKGCGELVEWAGVAWLDASTTDRHSCPPLGRRQVPVRLYPALPAYRSDQAHLMGWWPQVHPVAAAVVGSGLVALVVAVIGGLWLLGQIVQAVRGG